MMFFLHENKFFQFLPKLLGGALLLVYATGAFAQVKREQLYKLRGGSRFEGIKTKNWKPVSGTVKLVSLVVSDKDGQQKPPGAKDSVSVFFFSTAAGDIKVAVFNQEKQYFMDPKKTAFSKDWNVFTWPARLLNEIGLSISQLQGIATARQGTQDIYFPICWQKPAATSKKMVAKATIVPDKDMVVNIALFSSDPNKPETAWNDQALKSDIPFSVELPPGLIASPKTVLMKISEKGGREFNYNICFF
jgi:hypothetical protein